MKRAERGSVCTGVWWCGRSQITWSILPAPKSIGGHGEPKRIASDLGGLLSLVIGAVVILGSAISFAARDLRLSLARSVITPAGRDAIAALRIAIGLAFVLAAPASRAPRTRRVLGLIVIIAG